MSLIIKIFITAVDLFLNLGKLIFIFFDDSECSSASESLLECQLALDDLGDQTNVYSLPDIHNLIS